MTYSLPGIPFTGIPFTGLPLKGLQDPPRTECVVASTVFCLDGSVTGEAVRSFVSRVAVVTAYPFEFDFPTRVKLCENFLDDCQVGYFFSIFFGPVVALPPVSPFSHGVNTVFGIGSDHKILGTWNLFKYSRDSC